MKTRRALVMDPNDNVATTIDDIDKGETVVLDIGGEEVEVTVAENIPFGHKFALAKLPVGGKAIKYGEYIGMMTETAAEGALVHRHNLTGERVAGGKLVAMKDTSDA